MKDEKYQAIAGASQKLKITQWDEIGDLNSKNGYNFRLTKNAFCRKFTCMVLHAFVAPCPIHP